MRLTDDQRNIIRRTARECFGPMARVYLFGSRTRDEARGGDIDLMVELQEGDVQEIVQAEVKFLARLQEQLGEQKIDLLVDYPGRRSHPPVFEVARRERVAV